MITKTSGNLIGTLAQAGAGAKRPGWLGRLGRGAWDAISDPFTVGLTAMGVAAGSDSVGGALGGTVAGTAGWKLGKGLQNKFLGNSLKGRALGTTASLVASSIGAMAGADLGGRFLPIWKRKQIQGVV